MNIKRIKNKWTGWCRWARQNAGLSLDELAEKWNVDPSVLSRFERGQKNTLDMAIRYIAEWPELSKALRLVIEQDSGGVNGG